MKRITVLLMATLVLGGCAAMVTPYQKAGLRGGYKDTKLADDRYRVDFMGNGFSTNDMAQAFGIMRGAELCQTAGFAYVQVTHADVQTVQTYVYSQYGGGTTVLSPTAHVTVQCSHDAGPDSRAAADIMAQTHADYPTATFKPSRDQPVT